MRELRLESGITQEDLAEKLHTRKTIVAQIENCPADIQLSTLAKAASFLARK